MQGTYIYHNACRDPVYLKRQKNGDAEGNQKRESASFAKMFLRSAIARARKFETHWTRSERAGSGSHHTPAHPIVADPVAFQTLQEPA